MLHYARNILARKKNESKPRIGDQLSSLLSFPGAKVSHKPLEAMFPEFSTYLQGAIAAFFGGASYETFEVLREGGRARAARVVKGNTKCYTMDLEISNPQCGAPYIHFDRARHRLSRVKLLRKLGRHYPDIFFLGTDGPWTQDGPQQLLIVLQDFISGPVCEFIEYEEVLELLRILRLSASLGMLLDYNQNHWLYKSADDAPGILYYVDKDYVDDSRPLENALRVGFDQCTIFLTLQNAPFYAKALVELAEDEFKDHHDLTGVVRDQIQQSIASLRLRKQTKIVQNRMESFELILDQSS
jgi:hypothetical protein